MTRIEGRCPEPIIPARIELMATLRRLRQEQGISQRGLAGPLGLSAHSAVADYEAGRRIPPNDILIAYERHFSVAAGELQALRARALAERARAAAGKLLAAPVAADASRNGAGLDSTAPDTDSIALDTVAPGRQLLAAGRWLVRHKRIMAGGVVLILFLVGRRVVVLSARSSGRPRCGRGAGARRQR
jgi:transcriptional regulator with XRE-family HTH domain